jgi:SAM-dependent methyltransferase
MRSDLKWRYWGAEDPLWAVAAWKGKRRPERAAWRDDEFLALGASDLEDIAGHWRHYGLVPESCVEIGCGAGRMTAALLGLFQSVVGLDVAPDQLKTARRLLHKHASRVALVLVDRPAIPLVDNSCTGMFSCHVFHHFSEYAGVESYLCEAYRVLAPGGTACFHIPVPGAHRGAAVSPMWQVVHKIEVTLPTSRAGPA